MDKLYLVKSKKGAISGPFSEKEILCRIADGEFSGEEKTALYPSSDWRPLSSHTLFYDKLIECLSGPPPSADPKDAAEESQASFAGKDASATVIMPSAAPKDPPKRKIKIRSPRPSEAREQSVVEEVIEMEEEGGAGLQKSVFLRPVLLALTVAALFLFYIMRKDPEPSSAYHISLKGPEGSSSPLDAVRLQRLKKKALAAYFQSDVSGFLKSQNHWSRILEGAPENLEAYWRLCLIYLELWPHSLQNAGDKKILRFVLERVGQLDQGGIHSALCKGVSDFLSGHYRKTTLTVDGAVKDPEVEPLVPYFYYLKAKALEKSGRGGDVLAYMEGVHKMIPQWAAPLFISGKTHYKRGEFSKAISFFTKVLSLYPEHREAGLLLGIIEYKALKQPALAERRLSKFLNEEFGFADPEILKEAHFIFARLLLQQQDKGLALKHGMKAYSFDPENEEIKTFLTSLGGRHPGKGEVKTRMLIYKGDILMDQGDCPQAQALYRKAYETDRRQNAMAAIRMARCYWKSGISGQAVQWLKKAISADPQRTESYFLLVDYLSAIYSFEEARDILRIAAREARGSYEIFKSHALVAFRERNFTAAAHYGLQSLKRYSQDMEVYLILSRAYRALGRKTEELKYAKQAVDKDPNSTEALIQFAFAESSAYGFSKGEKSLQRLIKKFPFTMECRQALGEHYFENDRLDKALEVFESMALNDPEYKPAHIFLGRIYSLKSAKGQNKAGMQTSVQHFLKAALLDPSDPEPLFRLGMSYMQSGLYLEAESHFEKAMGINSRYPMIHYYFGRANFLQGGRKI